jgi:hypothetical protein
MPQRLYKHHNLIDPTMPIAILLIYNHLDSQALLIHSSEKFLAKSSIFSRGWGKESKGKRKQEERS